MGKGKVDHAYGVIASSGICPGRVRGVALRPVQRRRPMKKILGLSLVLAVAPFAQAADIEAGKARAASVCAACHGANGVSVSDTIPNLAAQRAGYLEAQLKAFKEGTRKAQSATSPTAIMNAIARSEEHTSELQSLAYLVCRLLLEKKKNK